MALNLSKLHAAAQKLEQQQAQARKEEPKRTNNTRSTRTNTTAKATKPKTDTAKEENGARYMISASFKQAIEGYLLGRGDMTEKMARKGKSIDKCCEFIYSMVLKKAKKLAKGKQYVGVCPPDSEVFGYAVHYYDEDDADLEKELKGE